MIEQLKTIREALEAAYTNGWPRLSDAKAVGEALTQLEAMAVAQQPVLVVQHGEICYKSRDDDQSYGMWCPVTPDSDHGLVNGAKLYTAAPVAQQPQAECAMCGGMGYIDGIGNRCGLCDGAGRQPQAEAVPLPQQVMVDMVPPATARDRWMYEQGRLAERDPRTHAAQQPQTITPAELAKRIECGEKWQVDQQPQAEAVPDVTDAMALAFHRALADFAIGQSEVEEIKTGLRAAFAAAPQQAEAVQACGHPMSLLLRSAESNEPLYCEACDDKSGRHDAERRETELLDANRRLQEKIGSADALKLHAIEELCQLGYTVKDGELFPPDHLHKLMEAANHPLCGKQTEAVPSSALNPDEGDPVTLWAEIWRLREAVKGPDGHATWQDAATAERIRRVRAESKQAEEAKAVPTHDDTDLIKQMLEALRSCSGVSHWPALIPTINAARKRLEAPQQAEAVPSDVVRDAERYRWLRNESWAGYNTGRGTPSVYTVDGAGNRRMMLAEEAMDEAIDAAIAQQKGQP